MGIVFLVERRSDQKEFAMKVVPYENETEKVLISNEVGLMLLNKGG
jgi:hypothetical protein